VLRSEAQDTGQAHGRKIYGSSKVDNEEGTMKVEDSLDLDFVRD